MMPSMLEVYPFWAATYVIFLYAVIFMFANLLSKLQIVSEHITFPEGRYGSLDGFRGILAVGVFIHHSFAAYGYFTTGTWDWSQSILLNHLGRTTVALFFMITGFLFALRVTSPKIDWKVFYISRFARLFPLYFIVCCAVFIMVFFISQGVMNEPWWLILLEALQWLSFVCFGRPDINGIPMTWTLIAGVNWSLKYEIIFYAFGVPALYMLTKICSLRLLLTMSILALIGLLLLRLFHLGGKEIVCASEFLAGIVVAYIYKAPRLLAMLKTKMFRIFTYVSIPLVFLIEKPFGLSSSLMALTIFPAIVGGLSMGGLLNSRAALWLGDISYGIYLIHGMALWVLFFVVKKYGNLMGLDVFGYVLLVSVAAILIIAFATLSYIKVEKPAIFFAKNLNKKYTYN